MEKKVNVLAGVGLFMAAFCLSGVVAAFGFNSDSVLLKDIEVLTLYNGKMTTGSRSSPVSQLQCTKGGTAPCDAFHPRVVQCYNRGFDGTDVQWECKSDMDNAYRFGEIEVSCEGYSHRDDPYVLKGSCGLSYSLDYTKEGLDQQQHHNYYGGQSTGYQGYSSPYQTHSSQSLSSWFADIIVLGAVLLMCWAFYKTCVASQHSREDARSTTEDDYPHGGGGGGRGGYGWFGQGGGQHHTAPPPTGFRNDASCGGNATHQAAGGSGVGGGFWTGAATGGLLGYMFGNSGRRNYWGGGNSGWGGGGGGWGGGGGGWTRGGGGWGGGGGSHSTGTRTASGFGGTSRR